MRLLFALLLVTLVLAGCDRDRPDAIQILDIERRADVPIPPLSVFRGREPVALVIRVPLASVREIVASAPRIELFVFECGREGRGQDADLYGDGLPLGRDWERLRIEPPPPMPDTVALLAFVPRKVLDQDRYDCARFFERNDNRDGSYSIFELSNVGRIRGSPSGIATSSQPRAN
jgi:hypothetical protein